jgi:hypothetical protein
MKLFAFVFSLIFVDVSLPAAQALHDSAGTGTPNLGIVRMKTLIIPAWGSWKQGSMGVTGAQALADGLALMAIVADLGNSSSSPGKGLAAAAGVLLLASNRLVSLPVNAYLASHPPEMGDVTALPRRHFAFSLDLGSYGSATSIGLVLQSKWVRGSAALGLTRFSNAYPLEPGADNLSRERNLEAWGYLGLALEGNIQVTRRLLVEPGCRVLAKRYRQYDTDERLSEIQGSQQRSVGVEVIPSLALNYRPVVPLILEAGFGYVAARSASEERFGAAARRAIGQGSSPDPWRSSFGLKVFLF